MNGGRYAIFVFPIKNDQYVYTYTHQVVANTFHRLYCNNSFAGMSQNFIVSLMVASMLA